MQEREAMLKTGPRRTEVIPQYSDIRPVGPDPSRIYWKAQEFRLLDAETRIVQLCQAISFSWHQTIACGPVQGPGNATASLRHRRNHPNLFGST
jgi:hypothetical protein